MKKLIYQLTGVQELTKAQMKAITGAEVSGGGGSGTPDEPTGDDEGGGDGLNGYMCCWNDDTSNCSICVTKAKSNWTCVPNAHLVAC